jgi:peroxiredoxin
MSLKLSLLFTFLTFSLFSQNAIIMGKVKNDKVKEIELVVDKTYLDNSVDVYTSGIEDGKFIFPIDLVLPQLVTIRYAHNEAQLFMEPNDTLIIDFEAEQFIFGMSFKGRAGDNNQFYRDFYQRHREERNEFEMKYYRQGNYYYRISNALDSTMRYTDSDEFIRNLRRDFLQKQGDLALAWTDTKKAYTEAFKNFMEADIYYDRAYTQLALWNIYGEYLRLPKSYLDFLNDIPAQDDTALGNDKYRNFISARMSYQYDNSTDESDVYVGQFNNANVQLSGMTRYFFQADLIRRGFESGDYEMTIPLYENFLTSNPYAELDKQVTDAFQKAHRFVAGTPAPDFSLSDINGKEVTLSQFKGKVIYLDFWATWCRPCVSKMADMAEFERRFKNSDVVFLHLSLDNDPVKWEQHVKINEYPGTHLIVAGGVNAEVSKNYDVRSVPKFFIINKNGTFAHTPDSNDLQDLLDSLLNLTRE